ncbi:hypothetical protein AB0C34_14495 [Nocardia sp. NPDC049220]|uniref:hypothetical protein n=1 Tax=Nocardia sp. NPDC049220 TaxID=3155273 RepID=UPI0033F048F9
MVEIRRGRTRRGITQVVTAIAAGIAAGGLAVACTASATTHAGPTQDAPRPTVVLVHDAFANGASWNDVLELVREDRNPVTAVADPLCGPTSAAADRAALMTATQRPIA